MIPKSLLPEGTQWCVAGGYAACPALASDVDVWVYNVAEGDLQRTRAMLLMHLAENNFSVLTEECKDKPEPQYEHSRTTLKVGIVDGQGIDHKKQVHLLVTSATTIMEILDGFDISTHALAIGSIGYVVKHKKWTPITEPPQLITSNERTPARWLRIAARYGHALTEAQLGISS